MIKAAVIFLCFAPAVGAQCSANSITSLGTINGHQAWGDVNASNKLVSWVSPDQCNVAYQTLVPVVNFWLNRMPQDGSGNPLWYGYDAATLAEPPAGVNAQAIVSGMAGCMIQAGLNWQQWTGDSSMLTNAVAFVNFVLANGMTQSTDSWPSVSYSAGHNVTYPYDGYEPPSGGASGTVEPDKMAYMGYWLTKLYEQTGTTAWLTQATHYADVLVDKQIAGDSTHSPWPFRVKASDGTVITPYTGNAHDAASLFGELVSINQHGAHSVADYAAAQASAVSWMLTYPVSTNNWDNCCEDIAGATPGNDITSTLAMFGAIYLATHSHLSEAETITAWVATNFGVTDLGGAVTIKEQAAYNYVTCGATSIYAYLNALLSTLTTGSTSAAYQDTALRSFNWLSYMLVTTWGPGEGQANAVPAQSGLFFRASNINMLQFMIPTVQLVPAIGNTQQLIPFPIPPSQYPLVTDVSVVGFLQSR